jgi:hypothetical protein
LRFSGCTVVWRGTPGADDWVAYLAQPSKKLILTSETAERKVKALVSRLRTMSKREILKLAKS